MRRVVSILFWSVIAAAFIGPGTVTTCAVAGARYGPVLLWALTFSTLACLVLQESAARLRLVAGLDLGEALRSRYPAGLRGAAMLALVVGAIIVGCAAYEAGNILGAVAGVNLMTSWPTWVLTCGLSALAGAALWNQPPRNVARALSLLVALMGVAFLCTAVAVYPSAAAVLRGAFVPAQPAGAGLLVLGLVGTTVVPYNLFLGSGIAGGQDIRTMRFGLAVAVGLGGLISMGILVVGATVSGAFSFAGLADVLRERLGAWASTLFALGLAAAGLSSAITAPLAAAVTARGLFAHSGADPRWTPRGWRYRLVWIGVLLVGLGFGLSGARPVPVILLAQALNGVLLPIAAIFILLTVNDRRLMGDDGVNTLAPNLAMAAIVLVTILLGSGGVLRAIHGTFGIAPPESSEITAIGVICIAALAIPIARSLLRRRERNPAGS